MSLQADENNPIFYIREKPKIEIQMIFKRVNLRNIIPWYLTLSKLINIVLNLYWISISGEKVIYTIYYQKNEIPLTI